MTDTNLYQTTFDRSGCEIGVVHIGLGAFHQAHQAIYFDDYMQASNDLRWGIAAVNLRPDDSKAFQSVASNTNGYIVKTIAPDSTSSWRRVRSHIKFVDASRQPESASDLIAMESVKLLTATVTESGYYLNKDWKLDFSEPAIAQSISEKHSATIYTYLTESLEKRFQTINQPITILCCDNLRNNGNILKQALIEFVVAQNRIDLATWIERNVAFPCSMVDRITPRSTNDLFNEVNDLFPNFTNSVIHAEEYSQWVIEDKFASDKPELERVGVEFVTDVKPFEEAKIRILNGGHTGLAYLAALSGHKTFDQAMRDPDLFSHFDRMEMREVLPGLGDSIPFDTKEYLLEISKRFGNPGIADGLERICMDGYTKMAIYIRPTLEACLKKGITPTASFDCIASWIVFARRYKKGISKIPYVDPYWETLAPMIEPGKEAVIASDPNIWGDLPKQFDNFVPSLVAAIHCMDQKWQA